MSLITCKKLRGGGNGLSYLFIGFLMFGAAISAKADVVDLGGDTVSKTGAEFKSAYNNNTIENGTVTVSSAHDNENMASGVYTIGNGATLTSDNIHQNGNLTLTVAGGTYISTGYITMPFRYGNQVLVLDNGVLSHTSSATASGVPQTVNIGYTWNNKDSSKGKNISARAVVVNGSRFEMTKSGNLGLGMNKAHERKINTMKVDFAVTNSTVFVSSGQIVMSGTDNAWISDTANSYVHAVFGPGADLTFKQIYAKGSYPAPSAIFDGATIHWVAGGNSFIGQASSVSGDIYEIQENGLTVDIPEGGALSCDVNSSALKGDGGIVKVGNGSITWNEITSSGSGRHLFSGPLIVSNGVWSSSVGYAASAFKVDGANSTLALSGTLTAAAPDFSITAGGTLDLTSEEPKDRTAGTLKFGENAVLKLNGGAMGVDSFSATSLDLAATAANPVKIEFTDAANISGGAYTLVAITGGGTFAAGDETKFALDANAPEGSTLSVSGSALVLNVPVTNPATWTGNALDGKFSTPGNWLGNAVPGADDEIEIKATAEVELDCDTSIAVKAISIHPESAKVTINGERSITLSEKIVNASEKMMVVNVPVEFKSGDEYVAIDVTGEVDFQVGVTGTYPVNHTTFHGNYNLTAKSWTLSKAITIAEGAKINAEGMKLSLNGNKLLRAYKNSEFKLSSLEHRNAGELFGDYFGLLKVSTIDLMNNSGNVVTLNKAFAGILYVDIVKSFVRSNRHKWEVEGETVIGNGGFRSAGGGYYLGAAGSRLVLRSSGDWSFSNDFNNTPHNGYYNYGYTIQASNLDIDTSDFDGNDEGHTVVVELGNTKASQPEKTLLGDSCVSAFGNGMFKFNNICYFTGGFTASNGVTVVVKKGVYPGKGDVTIKDTATFNLVQSDSGTVPVAGKLTMEGGSTLHIPQFSASVVPISVNSLEFVNVENNKKVALKIDSGSLINGYNVILESDNAIPENAWSMIDVDISADGVSIPEGMETSYVTQGNALCILVKGANDCIWTGSGETPAFSEQANWRDGKTPSNGANLYIPTSSDITIINDIENFYPASITFSAGSGAVTIDGKESIKVTAITNLSSSSHTINVPVYFNEAIAVVQNARGYKTRSESHIVFSGGAYAKEGKTIASWDDGYSWAVFGNYFYSNNSESPYTVKDYKRVESDDIRFVVGDNSTLSIPYAGDMRELEICSGSVVNVGEMRLTGSNDRVTHKNLGEIVVTNLYITGSGDRFLTYDQSGNVSSVFKFMSVTNELSSNWFYLSDGNKATRHTVYVGELGLNFSQSATGAYCIGRNVDGNVETIRPWYSDFVIADHGNNNARIVFNRDVIFCTDDENGVGRKITVDAVTRGNSAPTITVSGSGILQINKMAQQDKTQPPVSVIDTATLAYKPGASLGSGLTTVNAGATFQVAESGEVALDGDLNLADGAKLKFAFSKRNIAPVLDVAEKTVTLGENKALTVAIDGVKRPCAGRHVLTSGGKFAGAVVSLDGNHPKWVLGVGVNDDGNIYADIKPIGTRIIVR